MRVNKPVALAAGFFMAAAGTMSIHRGHLSLVELAFN